MSDTVKTSPATLFKTTAITVPTTAGGISLGTPQAGRVGIEIQNTGGNPVFVGLTGVTTSTGRRIAAGDAWAIDLAANVTLYAIASGGSSTVIVTEIR